MKTSLILIVLPIVAGTGWLLYGMRSGDAGASAVRYRTARVERGEVIQGVSSTGTVQPVVLVQVGTQVSGVIEKLFVDFNSQVKAGQTIALLDSRRLAAQVGSDEAGSARAQADLVRLRAAVKQSQAEVQHVQAQLTQSEHDLARQRTLAEKKLIAPADLDGAIASRDSLVAQLAAAQSAVEQSTAQVAVGEAAVVQADAQLAGDRIDLDYATIVSPVDGTVVSRNVDVGQTVAASLQAPTLFLIAQDLTKVQVQVSVPEADIGQLHQGQPAHFVVDAYTDRGFDGVVSQVRLASTSVQNVVTYTVVVDASNPDGLLFPGMTATLTFEIARSASDALHVPSTAVRLQPPPELLGGSPPVRSAVGDVVYVPAPGNRLRAVPVKRGISDLASVVVEPLEPGALAPGSEVVTAILREQEAATTNPFAPPRVAGGRPR